MLVPSLGPQNLRPKAIAPVFLRWSNQSLECSTRPRLHVPGLNSGSKFPVLCSFQPDCRQGGSQLDCPSAPLLVFRGIERWVGRRSQSQPEQPQEALKEHWPLMDFTRAGGQLLNTLRTYRDMLVISSDLSLLHRPQYTSNFPFNLQNQVYFKVTAETSYL